MKEKIVMKKIKFAPLMLGATLLASCMLPGCFGGGGNEGGEGDKTEVRIGVEAKGYGSQFAYDLADAYNKTQNEVEVKVVKATSQAGLHTNQLGLGAKKNKYDLFFTLTQSVFATQNQAGKAHWADLSDVYDAVAEGYVESDGVKTIEDLMDPTYVSQFTYKDGKQYSIPFTSSRSGVSTTLDMDYGCALFLIVKYRGKAAPAVPAALRQSVKIEGPWTVSFQQGRGAPESIIWNTLTDWTASEDEGLRYFSGTADYTATLNLDKEITGNAVMSLGNVRNIARVTVNGTECGVAWKAPFTVDIPAGVLKVGKNKVSVTVANLWVNRIIGDMRSDGRQQFTVTPREFYKPDSILLPSGLLGPVELKY